MRIWVGAMLLMAAQAAQAGERAPPYYGPMKAWHGVGYTFGYRHALEPDGSMKVEATTRSRDALDMAMYRAAELAHQQGFAYVEFLGGSGTQSPGMSTSIVYARPSHSPAVPTGCRSKRATTCYTADVAEVMRVLGGPDGMQPGVAIADHVDQYGRQVIFSGFGTGMATVNANGGLVPPPRRVPAAPPVASRAVQFAAPMRAPESRATPMRRVPASAASEMSTLTRAVQAAQPVRGRDPRQGWTISD